MNQLFESNQPGEYVKSNRVLNTPSEFAKRALFYVQETGYLKSIKSHLHQRKNLSSYLICMVLSGTGEFTYAGQTFILQANDCIFLSCMEAYSHQSDPEHPWELLWIHFNGYAAEEYYQYFLQANTTLFHPLAPETYRCTLEQILQIHQEKETYWELIGSKMITELLTMCVTEKQKQSAQYNPILDKLQQIKSYIDQNFQRKICLDQLSVDFYISKYHLSHEYKRVYNITVLNYITLKRITYAKELLRFSDMTIEEIAEACGYTDSSYFNKVFQKLESMGGTEYRKRWISTSSHNGI